MVEPQSPLLRGERLTISDGASGRRCETFDPASTFVDLDRGDRLRHVAVPPLEGVEQHPLVCEGDFAKCRI